MFLEGVQQWEQESWTAEKEGGGRVEGVQKRVQSNGFDTQ